MKWIKKLMFISLIMAAMMSCSDEDSVTDDPVVIDDPNDPPPTGEVEVGKKGVAFTNNAQGWSFRTSDMKAHWMYSWGNFLRDEIPENVEYVPMIWGRNAANDEVIDRLKDLKDQGKIKYLLGFNEPDHVPQANMTVDEAIDLWPKLEEVGVPLGSPATVNPNNEWMQEFMQRADAEGLRVDFITVHHYGGASVNNFINKLTTTYNAYGQRPIWITEFAVADWNATSPSANQYSEQQVITFMENALPALEQIDYVERYAWFDAQQNMPQLYSSSLFDADLNITSVGQTYSNVSPNSNIGPGQATEFEQPVEDGELFLNGGFESGQISPWGGFKNGVVTLGGVEPRTGNFAGRIENGDGSLFYELEVEPGQTYDMQYFTKWKEATTETIRGAVRDTDADALLFEMEDLPTSTEEWSEGNYQFTIPSGVNNIRILFYKTNGFPPLFFDDMSLKLAE